MSNTTPAGMTVKDIAKFATGFDYDRMSETRIEEVELQIEGFINAIRLADLQKMAKTWCLDTEEVDEYLAEERLS